MLSFEFIDNWNDLQFSQNFFNHLIFLSGQDLGPDLLAVRGLGPNLPVNAVPGLVPDLPGSGIIRGLAVGLSLQREKSRKLLMLKHVFQFLWNCLLFFLIWFLIKHCIFLSLGHARVQDHGHAQGHAQDRSHARDRVHGRVRFRQCSSPTEVLIEALPHLVSS